MAKKRRLLSGGHNIRGALHVSSPMHACHRTQGRFQSADGLSLAYRRWSGEADARAAVAVVHGYGDHSGRYDNLGVHLAALGYRVYACDLRGHGLSPGRRGHIRRFSEYHQDAAALLTLARASEPGVPLFLLGHSMGGLIAAGLASGTPRLTCAGHAREARSANRPAASGMPPLRGLALSSPFLKLRMPVPAWKWAAAAMLSGVAPGLPLPGDLPLEWLTHDAEIVEATRRDPLTHRLATPRWFTETLRAQRLALDAAPSIGVSVALLYAGADKIADPAESARFFERLSVKKTVCRYDGYYHEIFNEVGREEVFHDLEAWLAGHC